MDTDSSGKATPDVAVMFGRDRRQRSAEGTGPDGGFVPACPKGGQPPLMSEIEVRMLKAG